MPTFNDEQRAAIETSARHVLVLAGAGTGKTTTIVGRCNHLIQSGVSEKNILLITFTRRAAGELRSRIHGADGRRSQVYASTFHSWAMQLIRRNPKVFQLESPTTIDRDDSVSIFRRFRRLQSKKSSAKAADLANFHSLVVNTRLAAPDAAELMGLDEDELPLFVEASKYYTEYKRQRNYIDYDDMLERVAEVLARGEVAEAVGKRFPHIMIDEMQDTNPLQYLIIDAFAPHTNIFCVGDDAQSIYGFRGADFESIHGFKKRYPEAVVLKLQENYRSTQEILDVSNWLLDQSPLRYDKKLHSARGSGQMPILQDFEDQWDQADYVAQTILEAHQVEEKWSNNMVLARTGYSARAVESRLIDHKIPYVLIGGQSLFDAKHVKDVMSLLRICANRHDELAWMRYLQLWKGLGEVTADRIFRAVALGEGPPLYGEPEGTALADVIADFSKSDAFGWTEPVARCLATRGTPAQMLDAALLALEDRLSTIFQSDNWDLRKRDFIYVRELAKKHSTMYAFVDEYLLNPVYEKMPAQGVDHDIVRLITIHSAKGLEASRCFVIDVARGLYPRAGRSKKEIEEERRVLYVALTRAANELHVTRAERGWAVPRAPGHDAPYFLDGLPMHLVDYSVDTGGVPGDELTINF